MWKISLKGLWAHKRRLVGTVLGGASSASRSSPARSCSATRCGPASTTLFTDANAGTDAVVRSATEIGSEADDPAGPSLDAVARRPRSRAVDGVAAAVPSVEGIGQLVGTDGDPIGGNGPPTHRRQLDRRPASSTPTTSSRAGRPRPPTRS